MQLDLSKSIEKLKKLQDKFNSTHNSMERYAILQAINSVAENDIAIHGHWEETYRDSMIKKIKKEN